MDFWVHVCIYKKLGALLVVMNQSQKYFLQYTLSMAEDMAVAS